MSPRPQTFSLSWSIIGPRFCILNKFLDNADVPVSRATHSAPLTVLSVVHVCRIIKLTVFDFLLSSSPLLLLLFLLFLLLLNLIDIYLQKVISGEMYATIGTY